MKLAQFIVAIRYTAAALRPRPLHSLLGPISTRPPTGKEIRRDPLCGAFHRSIEQSCLTYIRFLDHLFTLNGFSQWPEEPPWPFPVVEAVVSVTAGARRSDDDDDMCLHVVAATTCTLWLPPTNMSTTCTSSLLPPNNWNVHHLHVVAVVSARRRCYRPTTGMSTTCTSPLPPARCGCHFSRRHCHLHVVAVISPTCT